MSWPEGEADHRAGQGELDHRGGGLEVRLEHRERRQVEVDRERAERGERAEQNDVQHPAAMRDRSRPGAA